MARRNIVLTVIILLALCGLANAGFFDFGGGGGSPFTGSGVIYGPALTHNIYPLYVETTAGFFNAANATGCPVGIVNAGTTTSPLTTSTTSLTIGYGTTGNITVGSGLALSVGQTIMILHDTSHYMIGNVTSYSSTTLVVYVTSINGSGTYSGSGAWSVSAYVDPIYGGLSGLSYRMPMLVSGAQGASSITVNTPPSGGIADAANGWSATILHVDGSYGIYTLFGCSSTTCNIFPNLQKSVSNGIAVNTWDMSEGQHVTAETFKAFAQYVYNYPTYAAYRSFYWFQYPDYAAWTDPGVDSGGNRALGITKQTWQRVNIFSPVNGNIQNQYGLGEGDNHHPNGSTYAGMVNAQSGLDSRSSSVFSDYEPPYAGDGVMMVIPNATGNPQGTLDFYTGMNAGLATTQMRVQVRVFNSFYTMPMNGSTPAPNVSMNYAALGGQSGDGVVIYDKSIQALTRHVIPIPAGTTYVAVICTINQADNTVNMIFGAVTLWATPTDLPNVMFPPGSRVVMLGDSWSTREGAAFETELNRLIIPSGGSVFNAGNAGQQASWAISNFSTLVTPQKPTHVIIEYYINDYNNGSAITTAINPELPIGESNPTPWKANINTLIGMVQAIGAQPIVIMPTPTSTIGQAYGLSRWAANLQEGTQHP